VIWLPSLASFPAFRSLITARDLIYVKPDEFERLR